MRLGKSAQAITASDCVGATRILVLCPAVARINWTREFMKFSARAIPSISLLSGHQWKPVPSPGIVTCSYDLLLNNAVFAWLSSIKWNVLILDEVHYLKEATAERTKRVFGKTGLVHVAQRCWGLSGTPTPNNNAELWILCYVFGITKLSYDEWVERYCETVELPIRTKNGGILYRTAIIGGKNIEELKALLKPHMLRRRRDQVLKDLPAINISHVAVESAEVDLARWWPSVMLGHDTEADIKALINAEQLAIDAAVGAMGRGDYAPDMLNAMAGKTKTCRRYTGLSKVPPIVELVSKELEAGAYQKIVLFAWHRDVIFALEEGFKKFHPLTLFGGTPPEKRDKRIQQFQTVPMYRVFIGQIKACGLAIELSAAWEVGMVESSYVPGDNAQAVMRVHNIKQTQPVNVRFFGAADTSDEKVQQVLRRKTRDILALFDEPDPPKREDIFS